MFALLALESKIIPLSPAETFTPHLETPNDCMFFWKKSGWKNMSLAEYAMERNNGGNALKKRQKHKRT